LAPSPRPAQPPAPTPVAAVTPRLDLLNLPRPKPNAPWAYVKVAEGCDRRCGFCAIPSFRGRQCSRQPEAILEEVEGLSVEEVVLVAQDLLSYGRDLGRPGAICDLVKAVSERVPRARLLYLYPSGLTDGLIDVVAATGCPYFDLSLQHVSHRLLRAMRRPGSPDRFLERIGRIRRVSPQAALRSSFVIGYPGETEEDHESLLAFLDEAQLDWAGFFRFSPEEGTLAAGLPERVPPPLVDERIRECSEVQDRITARRRVDLIGQKVRLLVDEPSLARSHREAPEIDGVDRVPAGFAPGQWLEATVTGACGPDLEAVA
jgi:ribosomal protein S12 methylthiotransferase